MGVCADFRIKNRQTLCLGCAEQAPVRSKEEQCLSLPLSSAVHFESHMKVKGIRRIQTVREQVPNRSVHLVITHGE